MLASAGKAWKRSSWSVSVNFAWDANPPGDSVLYYTLYVGSSPGSYSSSINVGNVTSYTFHAGSLGLYYALTATNANGESAKSEERH